MLQFYSKARGYEQLACFFVEWAQREILECGGYSKALKLLKEGHKFCDKVEVWQTEQPDYPPKLSMVQLYVDATALVERDPEEAISICKRILSEHTSESLVEIADCCALMTKSFFQLKDYSSSYKMMEKMKSMSVDTNKYFGNEMIQIIYKSQGIEEIKSEDDNEYQDDVTN